MIAGIEPSSSLLITLMIQTDHVQYIKRAAESKKCIHEWTNFGVDFITIDGKQFFLTGKLFFVQTFSYVSFLYYATILYMYFVIVDGMKKK